MIEYVIRSYFIKLFGATNLAFSIIIRSYAHIILFTIRLDKLIQLF